MIGYSGSSIRNLKGIKTRFKTTISFCGKENEVVS
jgi:hypothetical protein